MSIEELVATSDAESKEDPKDEGSMVDDNRFDRKECTIYIKVQAHAKSLPSYVVSTAQLQATGN